MRSVRLARRRGVYVALNLLTFPGVTDRAGEAERLCALVAEARVDQVQTRPLAIDPDLYMGIARERGAGGEALGIPALVRALRRARPGLVVGNFSRGLGRAEPAGPGGAELSHDPGVDAELPLQKDLARHLRAGHPWVFRRAVERAPSRLPAGAHRGRDRGRALRGPRLLRPALGHLRPDPDARAGRGHRRGLLAPPGGPGPGAAPRARVRAPTPTGWCTARATGCPGVIVDRYDRFAVLKLYSAGLTPHRAAIVEAVRAEAEGLAGVFGRDEVGREDDDEDEAAGTGRRARGGCSGARSRRSGSRSTSTG